MSIKEQLERDIKKAMLAGEKQLVTTLRGLKSCILYAEVAAGKRDVGLPEEQMITILQKEAKKRQESADLYRQGKNEHKAVQEEAEKVVINQYLPKQMDELEVKALVAAEVAKMGSMSQNQMGQLIGAVKKVSNGTADGALIAKYAKEYISE